MVVDDCEVLTLVAYCKAYFRDVLEEIVDEFVEFFLMYGSRRKGEGGGDRE